ncbi:MAG: YggS family pyridoxal phosphate-dependent enzyme [Bacteroidetes bacterium]|nr:YggS family pyridoxal phosphate-dependent enzyme [Bacteroidota bacterium]MCL5027016.1 YggS family pyridoxal phosphate-dependent enzyme [Chloroflexota bacterium]
MAQLDVDISANLAEVRLCIAAAALRVGRDPDEVTLVAVSKTIDAARVRAAYAAGQRHFGENRVQEAEGKIGALADLADIHWHLVGHLQTNKVRPALGLFQLIESVDSVHLAEAISRQALVQERVAHILLEVNVAGEPSKYGFRPAELPDAAARIAGLPGIALRGLMTVAPAVADPEEVRPVFRTLRGLRDDLQQQVPESRWAHLSMGMTEDFEVAVEEGATIVRIGRAIFGPRA